MVSFDAPAANPEGEMWMAERLLALAVSFAAPRFPIRVVLNDISLWRRVVAGGALDDAGVDSLLRLLSKTAAAERPALLSAHGASAEAIALAIFAAADPAIAPDGPAARRASSLVALARRARDAYGVEVVIRLGDYHASEFHDGVVFQIVATSDERRVGDGGSCGAFAKRFFGRPVGLYSTAFGLEDVASRLASVPVPAADVMIGVGGTPEPRALAARLADTLWAHCVAVYEQSACGCGAAALRRAHALGIPFFIRIDADEVRTGSIRIRAADGTLTTMELGSVPSWIRSHWDLTGPTSREPER